MDLLFLALFRFFFLLGGIIDVIGLFYFIGVVELLVMYEATFVDRIVSSLTSSYLLMWKVQR